MTTTVQDNYTIADVLGRTAPRCGRLCWRAAVKIAGQLSLFAVQTTPTDGSRCRRRFDSPQ